MPSIAGLSNSELAYPSTAVTGLIVRERFNLENEHSIDVSANIAESPQAQEQPKQKLFTGEEVDGIVKHKVERMRAKLESELKPQEAPVTANPAVDIDSLTGELERRIEAKYKQQKEAEQQQEFERAHAKVAQEYNAKLMAAKNSGEYEDFHDVMSEFNHDSHQYLVIGAAQLPNTADVIYELAKNNPLKAMQLNELAKYNPQGFQKTLQKLSASIEENKAAKKNVSKAPAPLSQVKSSTTGAVKSTSSDDQAALRLKYRR